MALMKHFKAGNSFSLYFLSAVRRDYHEENNHRGTSANRRADDDGP